ncbi:MAG TPA: L,D-transpeptidase [Anaerolineae bacterium]|nr:L,D-transpeptidase [Anaerolineae bacterium]
MKLINQDKLSRREFLHFFISGTLGLANLSLAPFHLSKKSSEGTPAVACLGRVLFDDVTAFSEPDPQSAVREAFSFNDVLNITKIIQGKHYNHSNSLWYELKNGTYVQTTNIQQVENRLNEPRLEINKRGELAMITVPYAQAWKSYRSNRKGYQLFYYGSNHWVIGIVENEEGEIFYKIREDRWADLYTVSARYMHIFHEDELQPLSQQTPLEDKHIEVSIAEQLLIAYETGKPVFLSRLSSGLLTENKDLSTPRGEFKINYKRPSRHMVHTDKVSINDAELYGVPWMSYFTDTGIAFHGTYWHNDFGTPHSHGCINLPLNAARWIYLWCQPVVPPLEKKFVSNFGTQVVII